MGGNSRVYFGKLSRDCRERDLEKLAKEFGRIKDIRLLQGFGFVEYEDSRDADDAVKDLDGTRFLGERIVVEIAKGGRDRDDDRRDSRRDDRRDRRRSPVRKMDHRIQVIGLPSQTTWQDLKDLMRKVGEVQYTNVLRSGDGVVEFVNIEDKEKALEMFKDYDYNGNTLTVKEDTTSGGGDRRRSRSRDRRDRSRSPRKDNSPKRSRSGSRSRDRD